MVFSMWPFNNLDTLWPSFEYKFKSSGHRVDFISRSCFRSKLINTVFLEVHLYFMKYILLKHLIYLKNTLNIDFLKDTENISTKSYDSF